MDMDLPVSLPLSLQDSPEGFFRAVEDKIKCLEEFIRTMMVYRNTLVPVSRLSPEILSIIFSLLPPFEVLHLESSSPILSSPAPHILHRWREISLNFPELWRHVSFSKLPPAASAVMLVRAKTAPLVNLEAQTIQWNEAKFKAFKEQIEAHIPHIRHLSITVKPKHLKMFGKLVSPAPSLESLSIDNQESPRVFSLVVISDNLFNGIAPKLTYLRFHNCGIRGQSPLLNGLHYFHFPYTHESHSMFGYAL